MVRVASGLLVDPETGELLEQRKPAAPRWVGERNSPGEPRQGATGSHKLPRTLPGGRSLRGAKK